MIKTVILVTLMICFCFLPLYGEESIAIIHVDRENANLTDQTYNWISDQIQNRIVQSKILRVIERNRINVVLDEKTLGQAGLVDEVSAVETGKLVGADFILIGNVGLLSKQRKYNISSRLVDIEKGVILDQWTATELPRRNVDDYVHQVSNGIIDLFSRKSALENIVSLVNHRPSFHVHTEVNQDTLRFGDMLSLSVRADADCYLYVFNVGTSGKIHLLFPNQIQPDNFVSREDSVLIENLRAGPPEGIEVIKTIAMIDSVSIEEMLELAGTDAVFRSYDQDTPSFARDLELIVSPLPDDKWSTSTASMVIVDR